jgi:hypothetical protein
MLSLNFTFRLRYLLRNLHPLDERHFNLFDKGLTVIGGRREVQLFRKFPRALQVWELSALMMGCRLWPQSRTVAEAQSVSDGARVCSLHYRLGDGAAWRPALPLRTLGRGCKELIKIKENKENSHTIVILLWSKYSYFVVAGNQMKEQRYASRRTYRSAGRTHRPFGSSP